MLVLTSIVRRAFCRSLFHTNCSEVRFTRRKLSSDSPIQIVTASIHLLRFVQFRLTVKDKKHKSTSRAKMDRMTDEPDVVIEEYEEVVGNLDELSDRVESEDAEAE